MSILSFQDVTQSFGAFDLFVGLSGSVPRDARIGLVGPNGIGKTTLLYILAGVQSPTTGRVYRAKNARMGYLPQEAVRAFADTGNTVYQEMLTVFQDLRAQEERLRALEAQMEAGNHSDELLERYGVLQEAFELAGGYEYELRVQQVLTGLGFYQEQQHMPLAHCSGGQKTRALLARLLLERPDLLILDEPTNHLDVEAVEWLETTLQAWPGALLIVSHDRYFLDKVSNVIWEMNGQGIEVYRGNYSAYLSQREERWARREAEFTTAVEHFLKELDFIKRNIVRDSTSDQAKGRLRRLVRMVKAVEQGGAEILNKDWSQVNREVDISDTKWNVAEVERRIKSLSSPTIRHHPIKMQLLTAERGGNIILRTKGLRVGYPQTPLFAAEDFELRRRECAALIGPNGTGKTTFLRTLLGQVAPLGGEFTIGANLTPGYFAQAQDALDLDQAVLDEFMSYRPNMLPAEARDYLARYLFRGDDVFKPIHALSGGERGRLALAILSLQKANLLLLDEPTNHLDIPAQETLEEALRRFEGTIVLVSHDRYLVDRLATQIWELRDGVLHVHKGGYASYLAWREAERERLRAQAPIAVTRPAPRPVQTPALGPDLAAAESQIEILEGALAELGRDLLQATEAQEWERVGELTRAYETAQLRLDELLAQWEAWALVHAEAT